MLRKILLLLCLFLPTTARAEWHEATSRNFVVYSEGSERDARRFAEKLERFRFLLRTVHQLTAEPPANRLRVYLLGNASDVAEMAGAGGGGIVGYYSPNSRGPMLVGTRSRGSSRSADIRTARYDVELDPESILLHEYAHHFMYQYFPAAYPTWYSEGFAEFWGATRLLPNDVIDIGLPADHRFATFRYLGWLPLERMMRAHSYDELNGSEVFLLYAQGWLLMRYVFEHPERRQQLNRYLALINDGMSYEEATRQAFPDLERFNSELYDYAGTARFNYIRLPFRTIDVGPITLRTPGPAEQALLRREIELSQGIPNREAAEFAREVRDIAGRFPDDPFALRLLMEAEWQAGNSEAALETADHLLRLEPDHVRAFAVKGRIQTTTLRAAASTDGAAWDAARQLLERAVRAAQNDPVVLEAYYDSFVDQGVMPSEAAQNALYRAMELAPNDGELRYKLALDFESRDMIAEAIAIIRPQALASPHRGNETQAERRERERREERWRDAGRVRHESAREMLARLETRLAQARQQTAAQR